MAADAHGLDNGRPETNPLIRAFIFDMDGTLVDTERLKARAYGEIVRTLLGNPASERRAMELYGKFVGLTDEGLARGMVDELDMGESLEPAMAEYGVSEPWDALNRLRYELYASRHGTAEGLRDAAYPHAVALAREQHERGRIVAVATSSRTGEARRVLRAIGLLDILAGVVGCDQVEKPKPHPEIYLQTASAIGVSPGEVLVVEDSAPGIAAARAAGMAWVAVANGFTASVLRREPEEHQQWIAYEPSELGRVAARRMADQETNGKE